MMNVIYKYKKLIWIWIVAHAIILVINLLLIRGGKWPNYLFTDYDKYPDMGLWPFVKFSEDSNGVQEFHGVFYRYDFTEFLLYMGLLVVFLTYKAVMVKEHRV